MCFCEKECVGVLVCVCVCARACVRVCVCTLKRVSNWPLFFFVSYTHIYRLMERKTKRFHEQTCPCGTVGANIGYVLGVLIRGKVVVKFGRKVFLVDRLL